MLRIWIALLIALTATASAAAQPRQGLRAAHLRCEHLQNPIGIDAQPPRLSWKVQALEADAYNKRQSAYQVMVASSRKNLDAGRGDLWDSGKVRSNQTVLVNYAGKPLKSRQQCFWKVRVWDEADRASAWSEPAQWSMGLLRPEDWKSKWIGYDGAMPNSDLSEDELKQLDVSALKWVWMAEGSGIDSPAGVAYFRKVVDIPRDQVRKAVFALTADDVFELRVNGQKIGDSFAGSDNWRNLYRLDVTSALKQGSNVLGILCENRGAGPAGLIGRLVVFMEDGQARTYPIDATWSSSGDAGEGWAEDTGSADGWAPAREVASAGEGPWGVPERDAGSQTRPIYLRREFNLNKPVARATVYATALGVYELFLNGDRVGDALLTPGWTDYRTNVLYHTYDVTDLLTTGDNAMGAILAPGWYGLRNRYGLDYRLRAQLEVEYGDGSIDVFGTGAPWSASFGPHTFADIYDGEEYDARLLKPGWTKAGFREQWEPVVAEDRDLRISAYPAEPVRRTGELKAQRVYESSPGVWVYDLGQNFTGWARLKASGPSGTQITLRFAEVLNPDGSVYTDNLRSARCTDRYVLAGNGTEVWEPSFTFHGFRYVEVTGYPGRPPQDAIVGIAVNSDTPEAGSFACSNELINRYWRNGTWTQRGNFLDIPTDCPQRDERLGWTGDAQVFIRTATYNMDVAAFFTKWLNDLEDMQAEDGGVADVAPNPGATGGGTAAWGDAITICPWTIYNVYGDIRVLRNHYDAMLKWVDYLKNHSDNLIRPAHGYGDWLSINADTPKDVISTAYFAHSVDLTARAARVLGEEQDAKRLDALFKDVKEAFIKAFVKDDGSVHGDTQTSYLLALRFGLLPEDVRPKTESRLVEDIRNRGTLSTGFVGVGHLLPVLTQTGNLDTAYMLMENTEYPSWLYPVTHGATSIWERWDGWHHERGYQNPSMNSFSHYAYGCAAEWLFTTVAGIDLAEPAFGEIIIRPRPGGSLTWARASYDSVNGPINVNWKKEANGTFLMDVEIPPNTKATIHVPATDASAVEEGAAGQKTLSHLHLESYEDGAAIFRGGSGRYSFRSTAP